MVNLSGGLRSCLIVNLSLAEASGGIKNLFDLPVVWWFELRSVELELIESIGSPGVGQGGDVGKMNSGLLKELNEELPTIGAGFTSSSDLFDQIEGGVHAEGSEHPGQRETRPSWIVNP